MISYNLFLTHTHTHTHARARASEFELIFYPMRKLLTSYLLDYNVRAVDNFLIG